ncbi:uracil phosphoribosyltransferase [Methylacidimicrobium cyclopophantes]|uniref:Uracil phosphoribosyltransferase n=1 Tax=Methylacidimicrobium cyclopophantes TaxID=1041766 RepID=A0A5E6MDQ3_9BACT|nr:uracil phosphoribosyltransferase [Methylacidimicrobium cyclopophantes]VVM05952.1 uracil phosphoribosyltransferase [Methylacidimicrobium cyclopophantes]
MPRLYHVQHPILLDRITRLRDRSTDQRLFIHFLEEAAFILAVEATRDLALRPIPVITPLEEAEGAVLAEPVALVPILRAGLGMLRPFRTLLPHATVSFVGAFRNEETLQPSVYLDRITGITPETCVLLLDPMLATGGTARAVFTLLRERGATRLRLACCVASPEGIRSVQEAHPDVVIYTGAVDRGLDQQGFILPGLGDAGDRQFGSRADLS